MSESFVYILTNKYRTTFYIGVTADISKRMAEHFDGSGGEFTKKHNIKYLIYFEVFSDIKQAIAREKQLKNWKHYWKIALIKENNPTLKTLKH